jgi:hypothetical protein
MTPGRANFPAANRGALLAAPQADGNQATLGGEFVPVLRNVDDGGDGCHRSDAVVDNITVQLRDDDINRHARLALSYSAGSGPATVFAKAVDPA